MGGTTGGILRDSGAEFVGYIGERRSEEEKEEAGDTLNSNNPTEGWGITFN